MHTKTYREKISKANRKRFQNPEERQKISESMKLVWQNPEYSEPLRQNLKTLYENNPILREQRRQEQLKRYENPEERERTSEITKNLWQNPEYVEKQKKGMEKSYDKRCKASANRWVNNPEFVAKMCMYSEEDILTILTMIWNKIKYKDIKKVFNTITPSLTYKIKTGKIYSFFTDLTSENYQEFWRQSYD